MPDPGDSLARRRWLVSLERGRRLLWPTQWQAGFGSDEALLRGRRLLLRALLHHRLKERMK